MLIPKTESELAQIIADAEGPLSIQGGGTRGMQCAGSVLNTRGLSGVSIYEPGALTLVAQAGTPLAEIEAMLAAEGQRLAFEPMDHSGLLNTTGTPTIGGVVAGNISGPRRISVGACRDFCLGVRFVDGTGRVLKNGGRVMKNVTGYDLVKLMSGSWGTLGVLSEVSLKVLPAPEKSGMVVIHGLTDAGAVQAMSRALGTPYEVTGAAHAPQGSDGQPITMLRIEGFEESVTYRAKALQKVLSEFGESSVELDQDRIASQWRWVRDAKAFHDHDGHVWRISVKPSDAPRLVRSLDAKAVLYDWGGGLIWALTAVDVDVRASLEKDRGGHATLVRGEGFARFHPEIPPIAKVSRGIRAKFDPRGILNAGMMEA